MKITPRDRKVLITGGIVVAAVAIFYVATSLVPSRTELRNEVESKKKYLIRQKEMLGQEATYKARLDQYKQRLDKNMSRLLNGTTPAIAGAELQSLLSDLASQSGVEITRKSALPEQKTQDNLVKVSVQIDTGCTPDQLIQFLAAIENYNKFLSIDQLVITTTMLRAQRRTDIRPTITVAGYIAAPEPPKPERAENGR